MRIHDVLLLVPLLLSALVSPAFAELPFRTEETETLQPGAFSVDFGVTLREGPRDFGVEDRDRQWELGDARFSFGIGKFAELQISGVAVSLIENGGTRSNSGDWVFGTKIWVLQEKEKRPSFAFLYEVKLPNGSDEDGGATDETDFFGYVLASKQIGQRDFLHGNLGLGILGNPFANSEQNDIYILRLAWERKLGEKALFGLEAVNEGGPARGDDVLLLRGTYGRKLDSFVVYGSVAAGLSEDSDDFQLGVGVRKRLALWQPDEPRRRNAW